MSDDVVSSCLECGVDVGWDLPCPNGCEPLNHYLQELPFKINLAEGDEDALLLLTLSDVLEIARRMAREESRDS